MSKKEYEAYIKSLVESGNSGIRDIGRKAMQSVWYLESFFPCEDHSYNSFCKSYEKTHGTKYAELCNDNDEYQQNIKGGWISFHGKFAACWADGII